MREFEKKNMKNTNALCAPGEVINTKFRPYFFLWLYLPSFLIFRLQASETLSLNFEFVIALCIALLYIVFFNIPYYKCGQKSAQSRRCDRCDVNGFFVMLSLILGKAHL